MKIDYYTIELQRDEVDFSDAKTIGEFNDIRVATAHLIDQADGHRRLIGGHRRLIGWLDLGAMRTPVELIRL